MKKRSSRARKLFDSRVLVRIVLASADRKITLSRFDLSNTDFADDHDGSGGRRLIDGHGATVVGARLVVVGELTPVITFDVG